MRNLAEHPTVRKAKALEAEQPGERTAVLDAEWLRRACLEAGADDVGFVRLERPELAGERESLLSALPGTRTLVSFVVRMNPPSVQSPARSIANLEFHHATDETNEVSRRIVQVLTGRGARALAPASGFPMEMDRYPGRSWVVAHKPVAVAAGLGQMGLHRNVIHPRFGNFILLGTVLTDAEVSAEGRPIDYNPCLDCKLCVAACPVGAISPEGHFNFSACYTHNYREFMGGFADWTDQLASGRGTEEYGRRFSDSETASMWQTLAFGPNYKAAYCMAVCPAGEDVIGPFLHDRRKYLDGVLRPLQDKPEPIYVVPGSDAEEIVAKRFPTKTVRLVRRSMRPTSVAGFIRSLPLVFQPGRAKDVEACFHFRFHGAEQAEATVEIRRGKLTVKQGLRGDADVRVTADARTWLGFLRGEKRLGWAVLRRRIRIEGRTALMRTFARCFRS